MISLIAANNSRVEYTISTSMDHNLPRYCIGPFSGICSLEQRDMKFTVFTEEIDKVLKIRFWSN